VSCGRPSFPWHRAYRLAAYEVRERTGGPRHPLAAHKRYVVSSPSLSWAKLNYKKLLSFAAIVCHLWHCASIVTIGLFIRTR